MHELAEAQAIPLRAAAAGARLGPGVTDQRFPSQDSTSTRTTPPALLELLKLPTAVQDLADEHETPFKDATPGPVPGLGTTAQVLPSQASTSARTAPPALLELLKLPTAVQDLADEHETPFRDATPGPVPGLGTTAQVLPSQDSTSVPLAERPTAVHQVAETQDTAARLAPPPELVAGPLAR